MAWRGRVAFRGGPHCISPQQLEQGGIAPTLAGQQEKEAPASGPGVMRELDRRMPDSAGEGVGLRAQFGDAGGTQDCLRL
jgi:hypothetical protein